jgi:hypothetical protein
VSLFGNWLKATRELQTLSFGTDPHDLEGAARAEFITWNHTAAVLELSEAMEEFPGWKPWVVNRGEVLRREAFIAEVVDTLHFVANMLSAVQCTDEELEAAYLAKMQKNRDRMASKEYDGVRDKCPFCRRELHEEQSTAHPDKTVLVCSEHGWMKGPE